MVFLRLAVTNLRRHRTRSLLTMLGIATSVAVLFSILSFNKGFTSSLDRELKKTGLHFMVVPSGCPHEVASLVLHGSIIPKFLNTSVMDAINAQPGIEFVSPMLVGQLPDRARGRVDLVYGIEMSRLSSLKPHWSIEGSAPVAENDILIGEEIAGHSGLRPGDKIRYDTFNEDLRVSGIVKKTGGQDDAFIYMDIKAAQRIFRRPTGATAIGVRVSDPASLTALTDALSEKVPGIQIVTMGQVMNSISNLAASAKVLSLSIALIAVIVSAVGVMNSMLMAVFERTSEIGMMRAVGASRLDVFRIIMKEGVILTLSGGAAGIVAAAAGGGVIERLAHKIMPYVPGGAMAGFDPAIAAGSLLFISAVGILSGLYPAYKASSISPVEAIRG